MITVETYLRIRPLDDARSKAKQDYYTVHPKGGVVPADSAKKSQVGKSCAGSAVVEVLGHPLAWAQPLATQQKLQSSYFTFDKVFNSQSNNVRNWRSYLTGLGNRLQR